jgi:hypothetical protein
VQAARNGQSYTGLRRRCHEWMSETDNCCSAWRTVWHGGAQSVALSQRRACEYDIGDEILSHGRAPKHKGWDLTRGFQQKRKAGNSPSKMASCPRNLSTN